MRCELAIPLRSPRLKGHGPASFYHCLCRLTAGQFIFKTTGPGPGAQQAEYFVRLLHRRAAFSGISTLTHALMANHSHLLCEVPQPRALSDPELLDRVEALYGPARRPGAGPAFELCVSDCAIKRAKGILLPCES
jgi:hypothetical protein